MRVLVTGGRSYGDRGRVFAELDRLNLANPISCVIHGAAPGADTLADEWALERGICQIRYPVTPKEWRTIGRGAGPARNARMLKEGRPSLVMAFPGGRGTADMVRKARAAGVMVMLG